MKRSTHCSHTHTHTDTPHTTQRVIVMHTGTSLIFNRLKEGCNGCLIGSCTRGTARFLYSQICSRCAAVCVCVCDVCACLPASMRVCAGVSQYDTLGCLCFLLSYPSLCSSFLHLCLFTSSSPHHLCLLRWTIL